MSALILLAPNPRVGYLLYPINFFVWAYLLAPAERQLDLMSDDVAAPAAADGRARHALNPDAARISRGLPPAGVGW